MSASVVMALSRSRRVGSGAHHRALQDLDRVASERVPSWPHCSQSAFSTTREPTRTLRKRDPNSTQTTALGRAYGGESKEYRLPTFLEPSRRFVRHHKSHKCLATGLREVASGQVIGCS